MNPIPTIRIVTVHEAHVLGHVLKVAEPECCLACAHSPKQRGVVLFFTLIALLAMSLAAVALIRSVDTSAMITGNLAYKEQVTTSADLGIQAAIGRLTTITNDNKVLHPDLDTDPTHPLNQTNLAVIRGYYSSFNPNMDVTASSLWDGPINGYDVAADSVGNRVFFIIQRMCRTPDVIKVDADCLLGPAPSNGGPANVKNAPQVCPTCKPPSQPAQIRVTVRSVGPNNSISYVQGFIF